MSQFIIKTHPLKEQWYTAYISQLSYETHRTNLAPKGERKAQRLPAEAEEIDLLYLANDLIEEYLQQNYTFPESDFITVEMHVIPTLLNLKDAPLKTVRYSIGAYRLPEPDPTTGAEYYYLANLMPEDEMR